MADKRARWGLLSTARINQRLIPCLKRSERNELMGVASRSRASAASYAAEHGIPKAYGSYEEMLADSTIDVVYVLCPTDCTPSGPSDVPRPGSMCFAKSRWPYPSKKWSNSLKPPSAAE